MEDSNSRWIPIDPTYRAGMYHRYEQVPPHYRLENHEPRFSKRDCWLEYVETNNLLREALSENHYLYMKRTEKRWKSFVRHKEIHHALCAPKDAEDYAKHLIENFNLKITTAADYWSDIEQFYRWMFHHAEYPHRYNPFVMAAITDETCCTLWTHSINPNWS